MKLRKLIILVMACLSLAGVTACGKGASKSQSGQVNQGETKEDKTEAKEDKTEAKEDVTEEKDTEVEDSSENEGNTEGNNEASTEFEIPIQADFTPVEGLSDKYADLDNRAFAYNGKVFTLGESTLKDLIDGGIPFDEKDLNNKGNNINSNYETSYYSADINDYVSMQFKFVNITKDAKTEEDCVLSYVRYYCLYVPQPNYSTERNESITENILDAAKTVCFSFPLTLTKEQLLKNSSEGAEQDEYNHVDYVVDSEIYYGSSGYNFKFNDTTNQLEQMSISWLP